MIIFSKHELNSMKFNHFSDEDINFLFQVRMSFLPPFVK